MDVLRRFAYTVAVGFSFVLLSAPILLPVLVFSTYSGLGNTLTAAKVFTTIALFSIMRFPFAFMPLGFTQVRALH